MSQEPPCVEAFDVPIVTIDSSILSSLSWDITIRHVLQFIDGDNAISEIAGTYPGMDIDIVKRAIRTLLHYKCIYITDKLKFTNIYELSQNGQELIMYLLEHQQQQILSNSNKTNDNGDMSHDHDHIHDSSSTAVLQSNSQNISNSHNSAQPLSNSHSAWHLLLHELINFCSVENDNKVPLVIILTLLTQFRPNRKLSEILLYTRSQLASTKFNIRKFIAYCVHHSILRRIHEYPVDLINLESGTLLTTEIPDSKRRNHNISTQAVNSHNMTDSDNMNGTSNISSHLNISSGMQNHLKSSIPPATTTTEKRSTNQSYNTAKSTISVVLNGNEHLDSICCKYRINHKTILLKPGVTIIYK